MSGDSILVLYKTELFSSCHSLSPYGDTIPHSQFHSSIDNTIIKDPASPSFQSPRPGPSRYHTPSQSFFPITTPWFLKISYAVAAWK